MKLPSLHDLKRLGQSALKKGLDPSALERGLQYLRDGGFSDMELAILGAKGHQLEFKLSETTKTRIEIGAPSQPTYSDCDCSMAGYGIYCKHQALATWVLASIASKQYDLIRMPEEVIEKIKSFEAEFDKMKPASAESTAASHPTAAGHSVHTERATHFLGHFEGLIFCFPHHPVSQTHSKSEYAFHKTVDAPPSYQDHLMPDLAIPYLRESPESFVESSVLNRNLTPVTLPRNAPNVSSMFM